jgi:hypothetical protein
MYETRGPEDNAPYPPKDDAQPDLDQVEDCPLCDGPRYGVHCKVICENCGYREDCSDIFPVN